MTGIYGIGYTNDEYEFYFDIEDYDMVCKHCWSIDKRKGYIITGIKNPDNNKQTTMPLHRYLLNPPKNLQVDHINGLKFDNRRENLRICTASENYKNIAIRSTNTSGHKGVYWNKRYNKWCSQIVCNGKHYWLGQHDNYEDAVQIRDRKEEELFGEFARNNLYINNRVPKSSY